MSYPVAVLFLCTHNSARSILAEAVPNHLGAGRFVGYSAGSTPRESGQPNPLTLRTLAEAGIPTAGLRSTCWDEFVGPAAPPIDLVITVCGSANEVYPVFRGRPATAHWGYDDPSAGEWPDEIKMVAFRTTLSQIKRRLEAFTSLPSASLDKMTLEQSARTLLNGP
jgi:protein-tyrosine-phosphatase